MVVAFFVLAAIYSLIKNYNYGFVFRQTLEFYLLCVLAMLTKGTAFIFLFPVVILFIILFIYKKKILAFPSFFSGLLIVSLLYFPFVYRNYQTYEYPLGKTYELNNKAYGIAPMLSNAVKNTFMHLRTPFPELNNSLTDAAIGVNEISGVDINSPSYNWAYTPKFEVGFFSSQEDSVGNIFQVILFTVCLIIFLMKKDLRKNRLILFYLIILILMFLTFSYVLKWQVWHTRLQLTMFIASAVFIAIIINKINAKVSVAITILFFLFASVFMFFNQSRPWFLKENIFNTSAIDQYFMNNKKLKQPFTEISEILHQKSYTSIGYVSGGDSWEYPFYVLNRDINNFHLENIYPENETISLVNDPDFKFFTPDVIVINRFPPDVSGEYFYHGNKYSLIYQFENIRCLKKDDHKLQKIVVSA